MRYIIVLLILMSNVALSYEDSDIDGVDDNIDMCLNTPFDEIVNEFGCSITQKSRTYIGNFSIKIDYDISDTIGVFGNYIYKSFDISISNYKSNKNSKLSGTHNQSDIYLSLGYLNRFTKSSTLKFEIEKRFYSANSNRLNKEDKQKNNRYIKKNFNDYLLCVTWSKFLNNNFDINSYYSYTISGHVNNKKNYSSFSVGSGYSFNSNFYTSIYYNYYDTYNPQETIGLFSSYDLSKNISLTTYYSYGLDELSHNSISFGGEFRF